MSRVQCSERLKCAASNGDAMDNDTRFMRMAIEKCREGIAEGQTPFGACIVRNGQVISCAHNNVWTNTDPTAHAEICAIREACEKLDTVKLEGCTIYSTTEPCPMCFAAIHWAKISRIVFGTRIKDAQVAGFSELSISNEEMKEYGISEVEIVSGVLKEEAQALFTKWASRKDKKTY